AEQDAADGADPTAEHEAGHGGGDHRLSLLGRELLAPVGQLLDLAAQDLERLGELPAVGLDRGADLLRGAGGHQAAPLAGDVVDVAPSPAAVTVSRILRASSIASSG